MPNGDSPKEPEEASSDGLPDERSSPSGVAERHHRVKDADTASLPGQSCPQMPKSLLHNVRAKQSMKVYKRGKAKPRPERSKSKIARNATEARDTNHETHHMNGVAPAPMTTQFRGTHQHLRVTIHEARKLIAKDMNGYSDPFVQVELEGQRTRTRVVPSSLNPRWEQVVHLMLPQILDGHSDKLKLTVLDYDGPLLQPRFLGRVEVPVADVWHAWKQGNSFSHKWYKLLGNRRTKQSDRGDLCLSLSFVDSHELSESTNQFLGPADKSESLKDADLNEWKLRVRIHHARAFDASPQDIEEFETLREYCYSVTVRLGSLERKTSFSQGNLSVVQEGQERTGMFLHTSWDETFDIPLEEATKTLKLDARINNQIMQLGNLIGLDGKFYDARKAMTNTDDVRFLISRVSKQDLPPSNRPPDNIPINGVGQFPLSAVFAFSTDPDEDLCDLKEAEANNSGSPDKAKQQQQQQQRESGASRASPSTMPEDLRNGSPGDHSSKGRAFMPRWQSFVSKAGKALEERVGWAHHHHSPMRSTVSVDGSDSDCESSSSSNSDDDGVVTGPVAQQAWIPIGGRNGAIAAELLVSLMFVKGGPERKSSPGAVSQKGQQKEDFEQWLNDLVEPAGDDEKAEPMAAVPPPLKDATFVDEELDIPLHRLFYMQVNQGSKFNKLRRFEQEIRDLEVHDWQDPEGGVKAQNSSFIMKLPPNKIGEERRVFASLPDCPISCVLLVPALVASLLAFPDVQAPTRPTRRSRWWLRPCRSAATSFARRSRTPRSHLGTHSTPWSRPLRSRCLPHGPAFRSALRANSSSPASSRARSRGLRSQAPRKAAGRIWRSSSGSFPGRTSPGPAARVWRARV